MAIREVLNIPNPLLYEISEPVTRFDRELRNLARDMFDTMYAANGVGLAGVQVGVLKRILVIDLADNGFIKGVFINPKVKTQSEEMQNGEEGCLSVPGLSANLARPREVTVEYQDLTGNTKEVNAELLMARALLHEMDHLDGKVFVDLLEPDLKTELNDDIERIKQGLKPIGTKEPKYRTERMAIRSKS